MRKQRWRDALRGPGRHAKCLMDDSWFEFDAARKSWDALDVESGTSCLCRHRPVKWLHDCVCNSVRTARLRLQILSPGRMRVPSSLDSMQTLIKPLNGNIAISQFQLMECDIDAVRGLISECAYREWLLSYMCPFQDVNALSSRRIKASKQIGRLLAHRSSGLLALVT